MEIHVKNQTAGVITYVDGKLVIHHGKQYKVVTNSPTYDKQLAIMEYWKDAGGLSKSCPAPRAPPTASFGHPTCSTCSRVKCPRSTSAVRHSRVSSFKPRWRYFR